MGIDLKELTISASIKKKALQHYDEMIAFAKKQKAKDFPNRSSMESEIGHSWFGDHCPYCSLFGVKTSEFLRQELGEKGLCVRCPLSDFPQGITMSGHCCDDLWLELCSAETWSQWISWAKKVKKFIEKKG